MLDPQAEKLTFKERQTPSFVPLLSPVWAQLALIPRDVAPVCSPRYNPQRTNPSHSSANDGEFSICGTNWKITYFRAKSAAKYLLLHFALENSVFYIMQASISKGLERQDASTSLQKIITLKKNTISPATLPYDLALLEFPGSRCHWRVPCQYVWPSKSNTLKPTEPGRECTSVNHTQTHCGNTRCQQQRRIYCFTHPQRVYVMSESLYKAIKKINSSSNKQL